MASIYGLVAALEVAADSYGFEVGVYALKPLLMPLLAFCLVAGMAWWTWPGLLLLGALCCSWVGDVLMMCGVFVGGLGAFLVAHVCYVIAFLGHARGAGRRRVTAGKVVGWLLLATFAVVMFSVLDPRLDDVLRMPVLAYMAAITLMAASAIDRRGRVAPVSFWLVTVGALLFIVSDSVIAWDRFVSPVALARPIIMGTYTLAQFLIVQGVLRQSGDY